MQTGSTSKGAAGAKRRVPFADPDITGTPISIAIFDEDPTLPEPPDPVAPRAPISKIERSKPFWVTVTVENPVNDPLEDSIAVYFYNANGEKLRPRGQIVEFIDIDPTTPDKTSGTIKVDKLGNVDPGDMIVIARPGKKGGNNDENKGKARSFAMTSLKLIQ